MVALTRHGDLERQLPDADALLALEPVLTASRLAVGPSGVAGGRTTEPYVLVGPKGFDGKGLRKIGALDLVAWYPTWAFWQWRGLRLRQLAPTWSFDPPGTADAEAAASAAGAPGAAPVGAAA